MRIKLYLGHFNLKGATFDRSISRLKARLRSVKQLRRGAELIRQEFSHNYRKSD